MVPRIALHSDGLEFSRIAYGTWRILDESPAPTVQQLADRLAACVDLGITTLDTAEIYGLYQVEGHLGQALKMQPGLRSQLEIVTKCGINIPSEEKANTRTKHYDATAGNLIACAEKSLRLLGIESIDVLLVHRPDWLTSAADTAEGLNQLIRAGKIRAAGVSNYTPSQFETLSAFVDQPLVTNQVEISLLHRDPIHDGTFDQCQRHRVCAMGWSPLAQGRLLDPNNEAASRVQALVQNDLGAKYDATTDQLAFAWLLQQPAQIVPILGTGKLDRIRLAAESCNIALTREDWYQLWEAAAGRQIP